ncbi:MAG TPA: hypothetical protein PLV06_06710 [Bacteroidales bacterium]|nr:hypothetical protein [Bacteroidales bacterium]HPF03233.1 hypothetical protein [Bacteroidales bacterium]HPJ59519.1 hypothetical protein [Bacteroidales bacterium]HPR12056.1 hypothetical protein [Bacteroidales bacterium]HRW85932.1 hypothetical protein [Bacteroidales bacterium]
MRKVILTLTFLLAAVIVNSQSLEEIVKKYSAANKLDKVAAFKTIRISGNMSMMGMDIPVEVWMKKPDKIKSVTNFNGQEVMQVFDGTKGYIMNPLTGASTPVEMSAAETKQILRNNMFNNYLDSYLKEGALTLEGEENVNGKAAHKIKAVLDGGISMIMYIDKSSGLMVKTSATVPAEGMTMTVDSYPADYKEINGLFLPMKTTTSAQGMEFVQTYSKVEVDVPMDDSIFTVK